MPWRVTRCSDGRYLTAQTFLVHRRHLNGSRSAIYMDGNSPADAIRTARLLSPQVVEFWARECNPAEYERIWDTTFWSGWQWEAFDRMWEQLGRQPGDPSGDASVAGGDSATPIGNSSSPGDQ